MTVSIDDQIKAVRRELAMRKNVYPGFVARGKMKQADADRELAAMQAVHDTLMGWACIEALRKEEGASVTLICDNPDFNGPNAKVLVRDSWTIWRTREFPGDTVLLALSAAFEAKKVTLATITGEP